MGNDDRESGLQPVHFLKISHHGSKNGSPRHQIDKVLPEQSPDGRPRFAVVSTREGAYSGVPDADTLTLFEGRTHLDDTRNLSDGGWFDISFPEDGRAPTSRPGP